jgi:hypothetical protein
MAAAFGCIMGIVRSTLDFDLLRLLQPAAHPHGSLTQAETPLSDAENLFREPGPLQLLFSIVETIVGYGSSKSLGGALNCFYLSLGVLSLFTLAATVTSRGASAGREFLSPPLVECA